MLDIKTFVVDALAGVIIGVLIVSFIILAVDSKNERQPSQTDPQIIETCAKTQTE